MLIELYHKFADNKLVLSLLLIATVILLRFLLTLLFKKSGWARQDVRRRIHMVHNFSNLLMVISLFAIWVSELRDFALSIAAFSVAIVIALRDVVACLVGGLYQASMRSFTIGDWVRIGDQFGEVIDNNWLSTTLLEIDPHGLGNGYTGTTLYVPNNVFFTQPVKNLNFMRRYIEHTFAIVRENKGDNPFAIKPYITERVLEHCESFKDVAERYCKLIESRMGVDLAGTEPKIKFSTSELGHDVLTITLFCPREEATNIEQKVTEDFYLFWYGAKAGPAGGALESVEAPV
ncbi:mechanosensitive ion channel family protein [Microbulbifer sp. CAU 1566]|uniref:mechanosensitive ion channel family protein n=1 Tax=Microbulbifer sp. CAU 1566 TaxID=2933269 RepID=UPI002006235D|nr:mechanosensitive ion channel domain-containing protein [Microbulbifer sp. CAU 1566]MCK7596767.1 mechanosensitive ion channel family protein [Microbulbifer sp. CAU 1566]